MLLIYGHTTGNTAVPTQDQLSILKHIPIQNPEVLIQILYMMTEAAILVVLPEFMD